MRGESFVMMSLTLAIIGLRRFTYSSPEHCRHAGTRDDNFERNMEQRALTQSAELLTSILLLRWRAGCRQ